MEYNSNLHLLFVDFKPAFDSIDRSRIYEIFELRIPDKFTRLSLMILEDTKARVLIQGNNECFRDKKWCKMGRRTVPNYNIFNLILHHTINDLYKGGHIMNRSYQILAYADDIAIVAKNLGDMMEVLQKLNNKAKEVGLLINESKTKYLRMTTEEKNDDRQNIYIAGYTFENVQSFT